MKNAFRLGYFFMIGVTLVGGPWPTVEFVRLGDLLLHYFLVTFFSAVWPLTWLVYILDKILSYPL